ncbi:hypothetical protein EJ06DRAFT_527767 [Trichodelitschia bisporula]|uniref:Uncharacterized protein n=1 Tax=Trichodelitschia bisporula TaxID=703511 RepID=A0A6G1I3N0_9PEZI|nr:hypothetical protein EJ06DRAFT_527767 [Trichodelitschia bisporula]
MQEWNWRLKARLWGFELSSTAGQNAKNEAVSCRARRGGRDWRRHSHMPRGIKFSYQLISS